MNLQPIILKVGGQTSKDIKDLKANKGRLLKEVEAAVRERFPLTVQQGGTTTERKLVPVVLVFRKKRERMMLQDVLLGLTSRRPR
jgi:hypothetical protein